ncbi:MAG TPA: transposase [Opitutaceae bacterium]|nr:transposase [Opitutaceae bacterium]
MARKLRLEFPGAIYHVINRGNYRSSLFKTDAAKAAFENCLFDTCKKSGWVLRAFVIMENHFHLAVETPQGNLVSGMQWLQSTFANRFNKLRGERGHLFQGRYKSLVVEAGSALGQVCHYIHLNPVRAGLVPVQRLPEYRYSSYWYLRNPKQRPEFLQMEPALIEAGGLVDEPRGWTAYQHYLAWQAENGPLGKNRAYVSLSQGWALGSAGFKQQLLKEGAADVEARAWDSVGAREVRQGRWRQALAEALKRIPEKSRESKMKSAPWKVAVAAHLRETTDVSNSWLAEQLDMGSGIYVSKHIGLLKKHAGQATELKKRIVKVKSKARLGRAENFTARKSAPGLRRTPRNS